MLPHHIVELLPINKGMSMEGTISFHTATPIKNIIKKYPPSPTATTPHSSPMMKMMVQEVEEKKDFYESSVDTSFLPFHIVIGGITCISKVAQPNLLLPTKDINSSKQNTSIEVVYLKTLLLYFLFYLLLFFFTYNSIRLIP